MCRTPPARRSRETRAIPSRGSDAGTGRGPPGTGPARRGARLMAPLSPRATGPVSAAAGPPAASVPRSPLEERGERLVGIGATDPCGLEQPSGLRKQCERGVAGEHRGRVVQRRLRRVDLERARTERGNETRAGARAASRWRRCGRRRRRGATRSRVPRVPGAGGARRHQLRPSSARRSRRVRIARPGGRRRGRGE